MITLLGKIFPPDPVEWALARAREIAAHPDLGTPWANPMPGLSEIGQCMAAAYQWQLHESLCPGKSNPHARELQRRFQL